MMLAYVNFEVPSIPTSAASCDEVQLTNAESSSYITFYNRQLLPRTASSKIQLPLALQPSITFGIFNSLGIKHAERINLKSPLLAF